MELNEKQFRRIAGLLPARRGNVKIQNRALLNALIYRGENGCRWRALPQTFGKWHSIYVRLNRRAEKGMPERVYTALVQEGLLNAGVYCLDSAAVKARPDARGAEKKRPAGKREVPGRLEHEDLCGSLRKLYKRRNERERFFRRLKGFRGIFTRYDKLDRMVTAFIYPAVICTACVA